MFVIRSRVGRIAYDGRESTTIRVDEARGINYVDAALDALAAGKRPARTTVRTTPYGCTVKY